MQTKVQPMINQAEIRARLRANRSDVPRFDAAKDGNPFFWIIQQAEATRKVQNEKSMQPRPQPDYLSGKAKPTI